MSDSDSDESNPPPSVAVAPPVLRNEDLPALFWDELPENMEEHPDAVAIQALIDESTPEERALSFKEQGNKALKTGLQQRKKFYLRQAIEQYTEGINLQCSDAKLNSILYSNRAHTNMLLGNYRNAMLDGQDAIRFDSTNIKAFFRAAKGALNISQWETCRSLCASGLAIEPDNAELKDIVAQATAREQAENDRAASEAKRHYEVRQPARHISDILLGRGWRVGRPQFAVGDRKPSIDGSDVVWPVLFFYPEASMQNDAIEAMNEHDPLEAHLDVMFDPNEAPPLVWDEEGRYTRNTIELYYLSYAAKPLDKEALTEALYGGWPRVVEEGPARYGPEAAKWVKVDDRKTLGEILDAKDHVVPGIPVFFVLAQDTPFKTQFLEGDIPLL